MSQKAIRKTYYVTSDLSALTGKIGEFTVDITKNVIVVFDGTTAGGIPLAKETHTHNNASSSNDGLMAKEDWDYLYNHPHNVATAFDNGFMSKEDKLKLDSMAGGGGSAVPYSSANVPSTLAYRDVNGDFSVRKITGTDFIGHLQGNSDTVTGGVYVSGTYANPSWLTELNGAKITGANSLPGSVIVGLPWTKLTGTIPNISIFPNDSSYVTTGGNITGTSGGVLSTGGRETANASVNTVILRDAFGRAKVVTPVASADIATKGYVDANVGGGSFRMASYSAGSTPDNISFTTVVINYSGVGRIKYIKYLKWLTPSANINWVFTLDGINSNYSMDEIIGFSTLSGDWATLELDISFTTTCVITVSGTSISLVPAGRYFFANALMFLKNA